MSSFLKRGAAARTAMAQDKAAQESRQTDNAVRRFWLPQGKAATITFLDGDLDSDEMLDLVAYHEHQVFMNGSYRNWFVCLKDEEGHGCPICESGDQPYLAAAFTVIDHSEWTSKKGKVYRDQPRLLIAKGEVIDTLVRQAIKRGGLAGCRFEVYRPDEKRSYSTGSQFDFEKKDPVDEVIKAFEQSPYDYEEVLPYKTAEQLSQLGFGEAPVHGGNDHDDPEDDLDDDIPF